MTKITYILSNINKALAFEWIATHINPQDIELSFVLLNPTTSALENYLIAHKFTVKRITYTSKRSMPLALLHTVVFLIKNKTSIVHCHLFDASIVGLIAAKLCGIKKRIYTRHHSTYHHTYFPSAVKYDKLCNYFATDIVAITSVVRNVLTEQEHVAPSKIHLIHHGFDLALFANVNTQTINALKLKYNPTSQSPVIGVISRYTAWKGIQYIIPAFKQLLATYPNAKLILANANGDYKTELQQLLQQLPTHNVVQIPFENDINALYQLFDVYVHTPIDERCEAFGQTYVEALATGIPSVFTLSGIANDFIINEKNALVVPYKNSSAIYTAINTLLTNTTLAANLTEQGKKDVAEQFNLPHYIAHLTQLYN